MVAKVDPVIVQLGKLLRRQLDNATLSQAAELLLNAVNSAYYKGFADGRKHVHRVHNPVVDVAPDVDYPTQTEKITPQYAMLFTAIDLLFELDQVEDFREAIQYLIENYEKDLLGVPLDELKAILEELDVPIVDGFD